MNGCRILKRKGYLVEDYKKGLALALAETGAIFFDKDLTLKDGRPTPCFINMAMFSTGRRSLKMGSFFAGMMVFQGIVKNTDIILGPSYKGSSIALSTNILFDAVNSGCLTLSGLNTGNKYNNINYTTKKESQQKSYKRKKNNKNLSLHFQIMLGDLLF